MYGSKKKQSIYIMSVVNNLIVAGQFVGITTNKGDILAYDGTSNSAFPVSLDGYILSSDSSQPHGLRWIPNSGGVQMDNINLLPFDFSTNNVLPTIVPNTSYTGISGDIMFSGTLNCTLSKARRFFTIGMYKNGAVISGTQKVYGGIDNVVISVPIHQSITLVGSDIFDIRIYVDNSDCYVTIEGISPYSNASVINSTQIIAVNTTTPYTIGDLSISNVLGTTNIIANINCVLNVRSYFYVGLYKNGSLVYGQQAKYGGIDNLIFPVMINIMIDLVASDYLDVKIHTDSVDSTVTVMERTLVYSGYSPTATLQPQINLSNTFSTNDINPQTVSGMTVTGLSGEYMIMGDLNCSLSKSRRNFYIGIFVNGNLVTYTNKTYGGVDSVIQSIPYFTVVTLHSLDVFEVKAWVSDVDCTLTIQNRNLFQIQC